VVEVYRRSRGACCLHFQGWWRKYVSPKHGHLPTRLHGVKTLKKKKKYIVMILTAANTSDIRQVLSCSSNSRQYKQQKDFDRYATLSHIPETPSVFWR
jgi:hypothetical protein